MTEKLILRDGSSVDVARPGGFDGQMWGELKEYLTNNPEEAKRMNADAKDPDAIRAALVKNAVNAYYTPKLEAKDDPIQEVLKTLETDASLSGDFQDAKRDGIEALRKMLSDDRVCRAVAKKASVPAELKAQLDKIASEPVTMQEAAKMGDMKYLEECVEKCLKTGPEAIDAPDAKGITALGYAVATGNGACMKFLVGSRADLMSVDSKGNSALHYAAGYGKKDCVTDLIELKADVNQSNKMGMTPLAVASQASQSACSDVLKSKGAK